MPTVDVDGMGAVALPVPPLAVLYHNSVLVAAAVADNATAVVFWQYEILATTGAVGIAVLDDVTPVYNA